MKRPMGRPRRRAYAGLVAVLLVLGVATAAAAQDQGFTIRDTEFADDGSTRLLLAIDEELEEPLSPDQVQITESGEVVEGLTVEPIGQSEAQAATIAVALVIDTSGSTEGEPLEAAKEAAKGFLGNLGEVDASSVVVEFNDTASVAAQLTDDLGSLDGPIDGLEADGETALFDAVELAAAQLEGTEGQRLMVVFSDGADTASDATQQQAIQAATAAEAPITSVILRSPDLDVTSLEGLANGSGGSAITVDSTAELADAFDTVAAELTNQYFVTYTSDITDPSELNLTVEVDLPSGQATQTFTVLNPRRPAPEVVAPPAVESSAGVFGGSLLLILGIVAAFIGFAALLYTLVLTPRSQAAKNLDRHLTSYVQGERRRGDSSPVAEALRRRASSLIEASPSGAQFESRVQKMLDQGALPLKSVELFAIMVVGALLLGMIGLALVGPRAVIVLAPLGILVPWLVVVVRRSKRLSRFLEMLPDTLQLMAGSLSAGYGVLQSIDMVTKESEDPMATEFGRVLVEARLGMPLEESLEAMAERMDSDDFRWVVLAMNIQREVGGNLAQLMQTISETLRNREALRRHIKALAAEGKLSAMVLVALPFFLAGYLIMVNPEYVGTLVESLIGWVLIVGGAIAMVIGILWIRSLIRAIEV